MLFADINRLKGEQQKPDIKGENRKMVEEVSSEQERKGGTTKTGEKKETPKKIETFQN